MQKLSAGVDNTAELKVTTQETKTNAISILCEIDDFVANQFCDNYRDSIVDRGFNTMYTEHTRTSPQGYRDPQI